MPQVDDCVLKLYLIVDRVDPQKIEIHPDETHHFQPHEGHMIHEGKVSSDEPRELRKPVDGFMVKDHADFHGDTTPGQIHYAAGRLVKRSIGLHDIIMAMWDVRIKRDANHKVRMIDRRDALGRVSDS